MAVTPSALVVRVDRSKVVPTAPPKVVVPPPVVFTVRERSVASKAFTVEAKVTALPVRVAFALSVTASL